MAIKHQTVTHPFPPFFREDSRILILGSFPSVRSREEGFFYGHPNNRFWKVIAGVFEEDAPNTIPEKEALLIRHRIALWDVVFQCDIHASSDASIRNVVPADLSAILEHARILRIFCNGRTSEKLFRKYQEEKCGQQAFMLPSTSPANAAWSLERLIGTWRIIRYSQYPAGPGILQE